MKNLFLFICLILANSSFSQDVSIPTKFIEDGALYSDLGETSTPIAQFKNNEDCIVIEYLGKDNYKIKYKDWIGVLSSDFLMINEDMMDLYYDYQEKARLRVVQEREERKKRLQEIIRNSPEEKAKREQDSIAKAEVAEKQRLAEEEFQRKQAALRTQQIKDSIAKAKVAERQRLEREALLRKQAEEKAKRKQDSIAKAKAAEKQRLAEEEFQRKQVALRKQKIIDSIAKIEAAERQRLAAEALLRKQAEEKAKRERDSIAKAKAAEKQRLAEEEFQRKQAALSAQQIKDSIAKAEESERQRLAAEALLRKQAEEKAKRERDSIAKAKAAEKQRLAVEALLRKQVEEKAKREKDSIAKAKAAEKQRLAVEALLRKQVEEKAKREKDSIAKAKAEKLNSEASEERNKCSYLINEYDDFYKEQLIRTDVYRLNNNLTIELYRQGRKVNIFLNLSENLGCASYLSSNRSSVKIQLENNQTITLYHSWNIDCEDFNFKGKISNSQLEKLKTSPIESMFFKGTKGSSEITQIDYRTFFIDKIRCIE